MFGDLIDYRHSKNLTEIRREFLESEMNLVQLPEFLEPDRARVLARDAERRDQLEPIFILMPGDEAGWAETRGRSVSRADYFAAPEPQRYCRFETTRSWSYSIGQTVLRGDCPLTLDEMHTLLTFGGAVSGKSLLKIRFACRRYSKGDFIGSHHENRLGRVLTGHLPLTEGWSAGDGAVVTFYGHDGSELAANSAYNAFTLVDVASHWRQRTSAITSDSPLHQLLFWYYA